jgi:hypothetical protein
VTTGKTPADNVPQSLGLVDSKASLYAMTLSQISVWWLFISFFGAAMVVAENDGGRVILSNEILRMWLLLKKKVVHVVRLSVTVEIICIALFHILFFFDMPSFIS